MNEPIYRLLQKFKDIYQRPLRVFMGNMGGTITSVPNEKRLLEPATDPKDLEEMLYDTLGLRLLTDQGLLNIELEFIQPIDSSQMNTTHREKITRAIERKHETFDGAIILHGTDTGAESSKYLGLSLPYFDPIKIWNARQHYGDAGEGVKVDGAAFRNFVKPIYIVSSQIPVPSTKLKSRMDSDGPMNIYVALMGIAEGILSGAGLLTNHTNILNGFASTKVTETAIPPYTSDDAVPSLASYTSLGLRYASGVSPESQGKLDSHVTIMSDASQFEKDITIVYATSHLTAVSLFQEAKNLELEEIADFLHSRIPRVFIYVTKGAGNVLEDDYKLLKLAEGMGAVNFRVPIPGGRIPKEPAYNVPGHEIAYLNVQPDTAKFKAQMVLSLEEKLGITQEQRIDFINFMMKARWGSEFLPER